ncbi:hypothetical protein CMV_000574 [Castanea mollissima]|uniref:BTB domain-containing protein n=1 Tax=Castanea mollissima TaxID=60419 RepID=A0A8J4S5F6_9ROSI|nr:hypothetical protein CMV_000574 [Castanea mollissima]
MPLELSHNPQVVELSSTVRPIRSVLLQVALQCKICSSDFMKEGRPEWFYSHSAVLINRSKFFASRVSLPNSSTCIEIHCSEFDYDDYVELLRLLYLPVGSILESLGSVKSAVGILQTAIAIHCEDITQSCTQYLEAVPWDDKEEELIIKAVAKLGPMAMPILARIQPVDASATKNVFVSAVRFAMSIGRPCPPFGDELKTSAQEQVEFMLGEDEDMPLITADDEVKSVTLSDIEWMCNILPKMDLMKDFVFKWAEISVRVLGIIEDEKLACVMWGLKVKLIQVTEKVLEAVGYGNVILPAPCRVQLLKTWLPYIRMIKPILDSKGNEDTEFPYMMTEDLCQSIEGAIVSLILSLPSNDQADILADWMKTEQLRFPDLTEAFEVWCYRTKSAKRRLVQGLDSINNATVSL